MQGMTYPASSLGRREFLTLAGAAALEAAIARKADAAPASLKGEWRNRQPGMAYRKLGRTNFIISEMVMGGNTITPTNYEHVLLALDHGMNYLDTAPAYGRTQSELGYAQVIKARKRDSFFLNSKVSVWDLNRNKLYQDIYASLDETEQKRLRNLALDEIARRQADAPDYFCNYFNGQRQELDQAALANVMEKQYGPRIDRGKNYRQLILDSVDESLTRLGTDHLDLLMCPHGVNTPHELLSHPEMFEAFETLRKQGKVRHFGVSAHTDPGGILEAAVKAKVYSAAMVAYNIVNHGYIDKALAAAHKAGLGVISMKAARPVFAGPNRPVDPKRVAVIEAAVPGPLKVPQKAYLWNLRNPNLAATISELVNAELVRDNLPLAAEKKA
ncbi:MAG: aldo/keto reductase [Acidobacteria bacterium]|nr:aldo/keto reductase [Acidobacteriota bacterium]